MLRIDVVSVNDEPMVPAPSAQFGPEGGTIGRGASNVLNLADRDLSVSRVHAEVAFRHGAPVLVVRGRNGLFVGENLLETGHEVPLRDGMEFQVGTFVLRAHVEALAEAPRAAADHVTSVFPAQVFGGLAASPAPASAPAPSSAGAAVLPDDFDPFADPAPAKAAAAASATLPDDFGLGIGEAPSKNIDEMFELGPANPTPASLLDPLPGGDVLSLDPLEAISGAAPAARPAPSIPDQVSEVRGAFTPPAARSPAPAAPSRDDPLLSLFDTNNSGERPAVDLEIPPPPPAIQPRPVAAAAPPPKPAPTAAPRPVAPPAASPAPRPTAAPAGDALTHAFLAGLGLPRLPLTDGITPELMERIGLLLRQAVEGTIDLLHARAATKREVRANVTMIVAKGNNPLKFSPDASVALGHLIVPLGHGFMPPRAALRDAYDDLRAHQMGVMAGMRAALAGVLSRFGPEELEKRLTQKSVLDSLLPMNRKAKLWDLFHELYGEISREAEDDFHTLFGREFVRAYEAQVQRLEQQAAAGGEAAVRH